MIYAFGDLELDVRSYELRHRGQPVPIEPQVFDVLVHLVSHRDRMVTKEELLDQVWGTRFVTESTLTSRVKAARRAVGDDGTRQAVIRTLHGRGYRFVADVAVRIPTSDATSAGGAPDSQGAAVAIAYAVAHPERVTHLVLYGSYARGPLSSGAPARHEAEARVVTELARVGWGRRNPAFRQVFSSSFMPHGTPDQWNAFDELQRTTTSPENAVRFLEVFFRLDVRDLAESVTAPTLVLHCRGDQVWPFEQGRQLAARIPGSRFVPLESENHLLFGHEPAWTQFIDEVDRFLAT